MLDGTARGTRGLWWSLTLLPIVVLVIGVARYHYDAPWWDSWYMVSLLEKHYAGTLTFADLWTQYNEHRIIVPAVIMLSMARLTAWNHAYECALTIALAAATFAVIIRKLSIQTHGQKAIVGDWSIPLIALLIFSLNQWQVWLWGWLHAVYLNVFCAVAMVLLLTRSPRQWWHVAFAAVLALIATLSFATGLVLWIVGLFLILVGAVRDGPRNASIQVVPWLAAAAAVFIVYFWGYEAVAAHPPLTEALRHPIRYAHYIVVYLGSPLSALDETWAFLWGLTGILSFAWCSYTLTRSTDGVKPLLPHFALALYAVGSAMLTGLARIGFGVEQAVSSRYISFANLLWVALVAMLYLVLRDKKIRVSRARIFSGALLIAIAAAAIVSAAHGAYTTDERYDAFAAARDEMIAAGDNEELVKRLTPLPKDQRDHLVQFLKERKLSLFRQGRGNSEP